MLVGQSRYAIMPTQPRSLLPGSPAIVARLATCMMSGCCSSYHSSPGSSKNVHHLDIVDRMGIGIPPVLGPGDSQRRLILLRKWLSRTVIMLGHKLPPPTTLLAAKAIGPHTLSPSREKKRGQPRSAKMKW